MVQAIFLEVPATKVNEFHTHITGVYEEVLGFYISMKHPSVVAVFGCEDHLPHDPRGLQLTDAPSLAEVKQIHAGLGALQDEDDGVLAFKPFQEPADVGAHGGL